MLDRIPAQMLRHDNLSQSRALAEAANLAQINAPYIFVFEAGQMKVFRPQAGATDLIGADLSTWARSAVDVTDLVALAGDFAALANNTIRDNGSFLPTLAWAGGGGSFAFAQRAGRWYQHDKLVTIDLVVDVTLTTLGSGELRIGGIGTGQRPVPGDFLGFLNIVSKNDAFAMPYGAGDCRILWNGAATNGAFSYFGGSGWESRFISGLSGGTPVGDGQVVTWMGGSARVLDWQPDPSNATQGRLVLTAENGVEATGTITNGVWTATAGGVFNGARPGDRTLNNNQFSAGQNIFFRASGSWLVA